MKTSGRKQKSGVSVVSAEHALRDFLTLPAGNTWPAPGTAIEFVQFPVVHGQKTSPIYTHLILASFNGFYFLLEKKPVHVRTHPLGPLFCPHTPCSSLLF